MPLISRTIPNLVQGISQQPEILRLNSQGTSQVNGFSSVVEGLKKRPPTTHIAKISSTTVGNASIHTINRDASERYIVIVKNGSLQVYDINGTAKTVVNQTNATNYLSSTNPIMSGAQDQARPSSSAPQTRATSSEPIVKLKDSNTGASAQSTSPN